MYQAVDSLPDVVFNSGADSFSVILEGKEAMMSKKGKRLGGRRIASDHSSIVPKVAPFLVAAQKVNGVKVNTGEVTPKASGNKRLRVWMIDTGRMGYHYVCAGGQRGRVTGSPECLLNVVKLWSDMAAKKGVQFVDEATTQLTK